MYSIQRYDSSQKALWDDLVRQSKNGTFLFRRDFMDYHADRFIDFSLIVFKNETPVAILPANRIGSTVHSHQGLTYGGLVLDANPGPEKIEKMISGICAYLSHEGVDVLKIKRIVPIYDKQPCFEMDYALFRIGAKLYRRDLNLAIDYAKPLEISKSKLKHFRRVSGMGLEIRNDNDFKAFWEQVLIPKLSEKYDTAPVHSLEEIQLLHSRFPLGILQYNVYSDGELLAGITLFNFGNVVKSQYGATTSAGEKSRALDYLFITLINEYSGTASFFDMGTVTAGETYNTGLLQQKKELGCNAYPLDFYEMHTANYPLLDNVIR